MFAFFAFQWSPLILNPSYTILHFLGATKVDFISMHFNLLGTDFRMVPNRMICNYQATSFFIQTLKHLSIALMMPMHKTSN